MAIRQDLIPLGSAAEWKNALRGIKHSFGHTWENCYAMHMTTGFNTYLYCFEAENTRIVCPISEREYGGYVDILKPFGFSGFVGNGESPEFQNYWKEFARCRGYVCGYLGLNPFFDLSSHFHPDEVYQYQTIQFLDMDPTLDELWANLSANRKRQLKGWDNICSDLVIEKSVLTDFFLDNFEDFFRRKNAPEFYFFSRDTLSYLFSLDNVLMVGAGNSGKVEAVSVFVYTADGGEYLFNVSLPGCNDHASILLWYGVNYLKSRQVPFLNLGGGGGGIREFKRRFGGRDLVLKCIKQIYDPAIYERLCRRANVDHKDVAGYFPAYRQRVKPVTTADVGNLHFADSMRVGH